MKNSQEVFERLVRATLDRQWEAPKAIRAVYGFLMREHVDQDHPGEVEKVAELATLPMQPEDRDAWMFGYRFCDAPTPPPPESIAQ